MVTKSRRRLISAIVRYTILTVWGLSPFSRSTGWSQRRPSRTSSGSRNTGLFSDPPTLTNYMNVRWVPSNMPRPNMQSPPRRRWFLWNSTVIAFSSTFLSVAFGSVLAYGVSRYRILSEVRMFSC